MALKATQTLRIVLRFSETSLGSPVNNKSEGGGMSECVSGMVHMAVQKKGALTTCQKFASLHNDIIANHSHQNNKARRAVVKSRMLPNQENSVKNRIECWKQLGERINTDSGQMFFKSTKENTVVIGFMFRLRDFFDQAAESGEIR